MHRRLDHDANDWVKFLVFAQSDENILRGYPSDATILKEFVQNADDAGASEIHFIWDWSEHPKESLIAEDMGVWQGPALWIYNNAVFKPEDFDHICALDNGP